MLRAEAENRFTLFHDELDRQLLRNVPILSETTLGLVEELFGYPNTALTLYKNTADNYHTIAHNFVENLVDVTTSDMHLGDPVRSYISQTPSLFSLSTINVVRASDVFALPSTNQKEVAQYLAFLAKSHLRHQAVAPVRDYRLIVFKSVDEEDFSDTEVELISRIAGIIFSKYQVEKHYSAVSILNKLKHQILVDEEIGVVILNAVLETVDYNETFLNFVKPEAGNIIASNYIKKMVTNKVAAHPSHTTIPIHDEAVFFRGTKIELHQRMVEVNPAIPGTSEKYYFLTARRTGGPSPGKVKTLAAQYNLSQREMEIIEYVAQGHTSEDIAKILFISTHTVRTHMKNIYAKMNINSQRTLLAIYNQNTPG